jgi:translation initiation factor IF-2
VLVLGLDALPAPGDSLQVVTDIERARKIAEHRELKAREMSLAKTSRLSLEQFQEQLRAGEVKELPIILKADVQGSVDVLTDTLSKLGTDKVKVRIIHGGAGAISESDVVFATTANAIIIGFNVRPERSAAQLADREGIDIRLHTVIYEVVDELKKAMAGLLEPIVKETFQGRADVKETFRVSKVGTIAGCIVQEGRATRDAQARLLRDNIVVYTGRVSSLKRFKDDASEVRAGQDCGIGLQNYNDIKPGDVIELFTTEKIAPQID